MWAWNTEESLTSHDPLALCFLRLSFKPFEKAGLYQQLTAMQVEGLHTLQELPLQVESRSSHVRFRLHLLQRYQKHKTHPSFFTLRCFSLAVPQLSSHSDCEGQFLLISFLCSYYCSYVEVHMIVRFSVLRNIARN